MTKIERKSKFEVPIDYVLNKLFPSTDIIFKDTGLDYKTNSIMIKKVVFYGAESSGKTTTMRYLAEEMTKRYKEYSRASYSRGNLEALMTYGWGDIGEEICPINMLCIDDLTGETINRKFVPQIFRLRHIASEVNQTNKGLVVMLIGTHDIFGIDKKIRIEPTFYFYKSVPRNKSDYTLARNTFGDEMLEEFNKYLVDIEDNGLPPNKMMWADRTRKGISTIPLAKKDYLQGIDDKVDEEEYNVGKKWWEQY